MAGSLEATLDDTPAGVVEALVATGWARRWPTAAAQAYRGGVDQPGPSAIEQARLAWRRAIEDTQHGLTSARDQAETELRRRWALLRDAVDGALATGMSLEEVGRRLGLPPGVVDTILGRELPNPGVA